MSSSSAALDFSGYIAERTKDFTGREWVFKTIDDWLADPKGPQFFILTGEPGVGKSAIAARLTQIREPAAYHFCVARQADTTDPLTFARSVSQQLCRFDGFARGILKDSGITVTAEQNIQENYGQAIGVQIEKLFLNPQAALVAFTHSVVEPLKALCGNDGDEKDEKSPLLILVDGLDEAAQHPGRETIVDLLANAGDVSAQVRFVLTSRPEGDVLDQFEHLEIPFHLLDGGAEENVADVRKYLDQQVQDSEISADLQEQLAASGVSRQVFVERLVEASRGNFLYLSYLLPSIASGAQPLDRLDRLDDLPKGLDGVYREFLRTRTVGEDKREWRSLYRPLLGALAAAQAPLSEAQLLQFSGLGKQDLDDGLQDVEQFLDPAGTREHRYQLYHQSLPDFLGDRDRAKEFWIDLMAVHTRIAESYWSRCHDDWSQCDAYSLRYLPVHLSGAGEGEKLGTLLLNFGWLQAKLEGIDVTALVADYDLLPGDAGERLVGDALRLSAHALSRDPAQLAGQLLARIPEHEKQLRDPILERALAVQEPWLRPLTASLAAERSIRWLRPVREENLNSVVFSPNGLWAAHVSGSFGPEPRDVVIWDLKEWKSRGPRFQTLARLNPFALALSNDARWCLYADSIGGVHRLDASGAEVWEGHAHGDVTIATLLAISSDGRRALSACYYERLIAWDIAAGHHEIVYDESNNYIEALVLDELGNSGVVARRDGSVVLLDLWPVRHRILFTLHGRPSVLARSSDNSVVAAATENGCIEVRSVSAPEPPIGIFATDRKPTSIALSSDLRHLAVGTEAGSVEVWHIESGARSAQYHGAHTYDVKRIVFSHDDSHVISADTHQIKEWALEASDEEKRESAGSRAVGQVKVTADGFRAVAVLENGSLGVWNMRTGAREWVLAPATGPRFGNSDVGPPVGLVLAAKARRVLSWNNKLLSVWDVKSRVSVGSLPVVDTRHAAITPDGKGIVYASGKAVSYWLPDRGESYVLGTYEVDPPRHVAISPDGKRALSLGDRKVLEWHLDAVHHPPLTGPLAHVLPAYSNSWTPSSRDKPTVSAYAGMEEAIVATGDGSLFVIHIGEKPERFSGSDESFVLSMLDQMVHKAEPERFLGSHEGDVNRLLVARDGKTIVTSSTDRKIVVWNLGARRCVAVLDPHPGYIEQLSESCQLALLRTLGGALKIVSLDDGSLVAAFQGDKPIITCAADADFRWVVACDRGGQMHFLHLEA